ncbi:NAC domain-containing protein 79-like [Silene latifolia]|uniref:NAC domain-containing protein 79-like n=1 Tax=Silene latifolia TaxID=37657 RepID=UPI003D77B967
MESKGKEPKAMCERDEDLENEDEELMKYYYLEDKILGWKFVQKMISGVDIYKYEPWELPPVAAVNAKTSTSGFLFFCPVVKNRATKSGYWKEVGSRRYVIYKGGRIGGFKQQLVYYRGKPPTGKRTDSIMYEYSLDPTLSADHKGVDRTSFVLCQISNLSDDIHQDYRFPGVVDVCHENVTGLS